MKSTKLLSLLLSATLANIVISSASAASTLVGLWRFDEPEGTNALDSSGFHHDGVLGGENGNVPARVPGQAGFGNALQFTNNGYDHCVVDVPGSEMLKIGMTADDTWSLAIWAYERTDGTGDYIATYGRFLSQDNGAGIQWDSGAWGDGQVYMWHGTLAAWRNGFGPAIAPLFDQWVHWALVYDGQVLTLYRNGNQGINGGKVSIQVHASLNFAGYTGSIQIGSQYNMTGREWHGKLDDVAVFKGALTEAEVRKIATGDFSDFVGGAPKIAAEPEDQVVNPGWDVTLRVGATSTLPFTYRWQFYGTNLSGATASSLALTGVNNDQAGPYQVIVANALGSITSRVAMVAVSVPLPPALVGLWRFDEDSGEIANDSSGLTNHGVLSGDMLPSRVASQTGFGQALQFQNDTVSHSYVEIAAHNSLQFGMTPNATWSIMAWTYERSDGANNFIANYGRLFAQNGGFGLNFDSGSYTWSDPQYYIWHHSLQPWQQGFGTTGVTPLLDRWIHLALVYDGTTLTLYRDGNQGQFGARTALPLRAGLNWPGYGSSIQIGTMMNMSGDRNWYGMIDDFAIFTGALTEAQVRTAASGDFAGCINPSPQLSLASSGGKAVLTWSWGVLQTSTELSPGAAWEDLTDARSPLVVAPADARRFYRVRQ